MNTEQGMLNDEVMSLKVQYSLFPVHYSIFKFIHG
jgi:hypothetical protein